MLKLLLIAASIGSLGGVTGGTVVANVVSSKHAMGPARVKIALGRAGPANRLKIPGIALAAGDRLQRPFDLHAASKAPILAVRLNARAAKRSRLDRDRRYGLKLRVDRCSRAWTLRSKTRPYTCRGVLTRVVPTRPVLGLVRMRGLANLNRTRVAHLLLTITLPAAAPNSLQGQRSSLLYSFTAVQAARS